MSRSQQETREHRSLVALPALVLCLVMAAGCSDSTSPAPEVQRLAFASDRNGTSQIFVVNEDGTNLEQLTHQKAGSDATEPAWSPDGSRIAFTEKYGISSRVVLMHADGTRPSPLTVTHWSWEGRLLGLMRTWSPSWGPDTSRLVVEAACRGYCEDQSDDFLMIINTDGFDPQVHVASLYVLSSPAWSPDGKWLAYAVSSPSSIDNRVGFYSVLDGEFASFKSQGCFSDGACNASTLPYYSSPTWSPDSRRLAYVASARQGDASRILTKAIDADDSLLVSLTPSDAMDADPAWSPDGSEIAFTSFVGGHWHVFTMNADGSERRQLTDGAFDDHHPTWSPMR